MVADQCMAATQVLLPCWLLFCGLFIGVAEIVYERVASHMDMHMFDLQWGYRDLPVDEDVQILHFKDEK